MMRNFFKISAVLVGLLGGCIAIYQFISGLVPSVAIYNHTHRDVEYTMNGIGYVLKSGQSMLHRHKNSEFYLVLDDDLSNITHISRYKLTGKEYSLCLDGETNMVCIERDDR